MTGLVIFLHGLGGTQYTWGAAPDFVKRSLETFNVATLEYSAARTARTSPSDIEVSAGRVLTEILTKYSSSDPIYLVGYSLGGLIAREVCRKLLEDPSKDELLDRIAAVLTVGTPLEGPRPRIATAVRFIPFLSKKIHQLGDSRFVFDRYRAAIRIAESRKVRRPQHIHLQIEDDGVIATHTRSQFTEDDIDGGVVPGVHRHFVKDNKTAEYLADVLVTHIRNIQNSFSAPYVRATKDSGVNQLHPLNKKDSRAVDNSAEETQENLPDRLILIACSNRKESGGVRGFSGPRPAGWVPQPSLRQRIISKRSNIYYMLKDAKLADGFERGGNRAHQAPNKALSHGPDLGGLGHEEAQYLPAWQRYIGRSYGPVQKSAWEAYIQGKSKFSVLIMSGLYGLVEAQEWIQNYDVHLTDTNAGQSVSSMWVELFTETVNAYVRQAHRGRKVNIYNLLCDNHYVGAIQWHLLPKQCSVFHLASPDAEDIELLPPAGTILNALLHDPESLETIERDSSTYALTDFGTPPDGLSHMRVLFESRVGLSKR
jgi:pimeloyl-ACP methyl ester carboxylesterase